MARFNPHHINAPQTLAAAAAWKDACLIKDGSIFSDQSIWTADVVRELIEHFVNNPDSSKNSFESKLRGQLAKTSAKAKQLMAEVLWLMHLFPSNMGPEAKRRLVGNVWGWSGQPLPQNHPSLSDAVLGGIGSAGPAYISHRWREVRFFINMLAILKQGDEAARRAILDDPWTFAAWLDAIPDDGQRQLKLILPFLLFPDDFERITSSIEIWKILSQLGGHDPADLRTMSKVAKDKALLDLREKLEGELGEAIDFYGDPVSEMWGDDQQAPAPMQSNLPTASAAPAPARPIDGIPLNQILYGPPGCGKTFRTVERAVQILDPAAVAAGALRTTIKARFDELVASGRIRFVTFHQSFSYEDFVEGLKAETVDGQVRYSVAPGVFKQLCQPQRAEGRLAIGRKFRDYEVLRSTPEILWIKKPQGGSELPLPWEILNTLRDLVSEGRISLEDIRTQKVFQRVPDSRLEKYLITGYRNILPDIVGAMLEGTPALTARPDGPRVLIIDEINRGNVSKIFGELITLIEETKRAGAEEALSVTLPYSKEPFSVPDDLYIIGTMNTADRSLASLDIALRRRFAFEEVEPDPAVLKDRTIGGVELSALLTAMNARIETLLDRDHRLGHASLIDLPSSDSIGALKAAFRRRIIPLLQEYFFDDWRRIRLVLNDHAKEDPADQIIVAADPLTGLAGQDDVGPPAQRWQVNEAALDRPSAYQQIIGAAA